MGMEINYHVAEIISLSMSRFDPKVLRSAFLVHNAIPWRWEGELDCIVVANGIAGSALGTEPLVVGGQQSFAVTHSPQIHATDYHTVLAADALLLIDPDKVDR